MRINTKIIALSLCLFVTAGASFGAENNQLTSAQKEQGWKLLFDGKSTQGWRSFKKQTFPDHGWKVQNGTLQCVAEGHGGDIITDRIFDNFELSWEWMIPKGANNGVKYFITEDRQQAIGHEYQMIDDPEVKEAKDGGKHSTAAFYDVLSPAKDKPLKPAGEWNSSRVIVRGNHVEHWLNGAKVLEYELGSEQVTKGVAESKFKTVAGFGTHIKGHILLTEHHDEANFRNIMIRELNTR